MKKKNTSIAIITSGILPIPAVNGGAVETLLDSFINVNEKKEKFDLFIFSIYNKDSRKLSYKYNNCKIIYIKINCIFKFIDKIVLFLATKIFKKTNSVFYGNFIKRLIFLYKTSKYLKKNNYDKVLIENNSISILSLKLFKNYKKYNGRYFFHLHNEFKSLNFLNKIIIKSNKIICVSNFIKKDLQKKINTYSTNNVKVVKNCINLNKFDLEFDDEQRKILKQKHNINEKDRVIVFVGRVIKEKGIFELIKAFKQLKAKNCKLLIVGSLFFNINKKNNLEKNILKLIEDIKKDVIFTGYIPNDSLYQYYKIADVVTLPSICNEAAGLTILEAMACKATVITTDVGGIKEYVLNDSAIILKNDYKLVYSLAKTIDELLLNENYRKTIGEKGFLNSLYYDEFRYFDEMVKSLQ